MTKRFSNRDPEIQNITPRTPEGTAVRNAYIQKMAAERAGHAFTHLDFTDIEMRLTPVDPEEAYLRGFPQSP